MRFTLTRGCGLIALTMTLASCGVTSNLNQQPTATEEDIAQISGTMASDPAVIEDGVFESEDETGASMLAGSPRGGAGTETLIHPLSYWRKITSVERNIEFAWADTDSTGRPSTVSVTVHKRLTGTFNIAAGDPPVEGPRDSAAVIVHKAMADDWDRKLVLHRERGEGDSERHWRLVEASGVRVKSVPNDADPTHIVSVRVQSGDLDVTFDDPLALFARHSLPVFNPSTEVHLTVTTERSDDVVVLIHHDHRFRMTPQGDNTYTATWTAPEALGVRHVGVNAMSRGTLFDDAAAYSSEAWLWPYVVPGGDIATNQP